MKNVLIGPPVPSPDMSENPTTCGINFTGQQRVNCTCAPDRFTPGARMVGGSRGVCECAAGQVMVNESVEP